MDIGVAQMRFVYESVGADGMAKEARFATLYNRRQEDVRAVGFNAAEVVFSANVFPLKRHRRFESI